MRGGSSRCAEAAQVAAGTERPSCSCEYEDSNRIIRCRALHRRRRELQQLAAHGVHVVGTVEDDGGDAVAGLVQNVAHENRASRFSRNAVTPSRASGWLSVTAVRMAMSSNACCSVVSAAL